jgi:hypothetical protein
VTRRSTSGLEAVRQRAGSLPIESYRYTLPIVFTQLTRAKHARTRSVTHGITANARAGSTSESCSVIDLKLMACQRVTTDEDWISIKGPRACNAVLGRTTAAICAGASLLSSSGNDFRRT